MLSHVQLLATAWTVARQAPLSIAIIYRLTAFPENLQKAFKEKDHTRHQDIVSAAAEGYLKPMNEEGNVCLVLGLLVFKSDGQGPGYATAAQGRLSGR